MPDQQEHTSLRVLLVDHDGDHAHTVEAALARYAEASFSVVWKDSVQGALDALEPSAQFDIVVTEYDFPASNGLDFCLEMNARDLHIPIVFLTGVKDFDLAVEAMKLGVEDFLMKDELSGMNLGRSLENVISRVQTRRGMRAVERRLKMAESRSEAVKELVVAVCHEFNNPLASIKISADLLKRLLTQREDAHLLESFEEYFTAVEREIIRLRDTNFERLDPHVAALRETRNNR